MFLTDSLGSSSATLPRIPGLSLSRRRERAIPSDQLEVRSVILASGRKTY